MAASDWIDSSMLEVGVGGSGLTVEQDALLTAIFVQSSISRKMQTNKAVVSTNGRTVTLYDDDMTTLLHTFDVSTDKNTRTPVLLAGAGNNIGSSVIVGYEADGVTPTGITYQVVVVDGALAVVEL